MTLCSLVCDYSQQTNLFFRNGNQARYVKRKWHRTELAHCVFPRLAIFLRKFDTVYQYIDLNIDL